jgi:septum formation protein
MAYWFNPGKTVILASGSPRRKQILSLMGFSFKTIVPVNFDEKSYLDPDHLNESLQELAYIKAKSISETNPEALVLSADTVVVNDSVILGKPADYEDAFKMLKSLSGKKHEVVTGVALLCAEENFCRTTVASTTVFFRNISDHEIEHYLHFPEYQDKAGSYAIQGKGMIFIDKIDGCFYNVVGLPVSGTINLFNEFTFRKEPSNV